MPRQFPTFQHLTRALQSGGNLLQGKRELSSLEQELLLSLNPFTDVAQNLGQGSIGGAIFAGLDPTPGNVVKKIGTKPAKLIAQRFQFLSDKLFDIQRQTVRRGLRPQSRADTLRRGQMDLERALIEKEQDRLIAQAREMGLTDEILEKALLER